jgi:hypothetical protein
MFRGGSRPQFSLLAKAKQDAAMVNTKGLFRQPLVAFGHPDSTRARGVAGPPDQREMEFRGIKDRSQMEFGNEGP